MKIPTFLVLASLAAQLPQSASARSECDAASLPLIPDVKYLAAQHVEEPVGHCLVAGVIGTETNFELLLPEAWNGKFVMGGGGGFVGSVANVALAYGALQKGYATVGTDTGHQGHPIDASWALNNFERVVSFGHQAVHRTAVTAKAVTAAYYGKPSSRDLFIGCSRGGGQGMMEAQRYPDDFDGIVAGAPAYNWTHALGAGAVQISQAMYPNPDNLGRAVIGPEDQQLIGEAVLAQCDGLDGIEDGILMDPRQCDFDVTSLACVEGQNSGCLTEEQVKAAKAIYDGPHDPQGQLYPGFPVGGELSPSGWGNWMTGGLDVGMDLSHFQEGVETAGGFELPPMPNALFGFGNGVLKYLVYHDPDWNYAEQKWDTFRNDVKAAAQTLNATDPDLSDFRKQGGKLLLFNSWNDMAATAYGTIQYYDEVLANDASAEDDVRLFIMPGVDHCSGGIGPDWVDYLDVIDAWVETGAAPDSVLAVWREALGHGSGARPVCAYPNVAKYDGKGDPRNPASFACAEP